MYRQTGFFFTFLDNKKKLHKKFPENPDRLPEDDGRRSKSAPGRWKISEPEFPTFPVEDFL